MQHTIAAVFDKQIQAQHALEDLVASGFPPDDLRLSQNGTPGQADEAYTDESRDDESIGAGIRSFFAEIFGSGSRDNAELYSGAVFQGNYVLTVNVPDDDLVDRATDVLGRYDPLNIGEEPSTWKSGGWAAPDSMRQSAGAPQQEIEQHQTQFSDRLRRAELESQERSAGSGQFADLDDDAYFRSHWVSNYGSSGGSYDDYAPAYRYGSALAGSDRYLGRDWDDMESDVRSDWEMKNPGSPWEKMKNAIRHGWEKMTG